MCILLQPNALVTCNHGWDDFILPTIIGSLRKPARVVVGLDHGRWRGQPWREVWHAGHAWGAVHGGRLRWHRGAAVDRQRWRQLLRLLSHLAPKWRFLHVQRLTLINKQDAKIAQQTTIYGKSPKFAAAKTPLPAAVGLWAGEALQGQAGQLV